MAWWASWRGSAQAQLFDGPTWAFLLDTAALHHVMWSAGRCELAAEVRLRGAKVGQTREDRARLRISVETTAETRPAGEGN